MINFLPQNKKREIDRLLKRRAYIILFFCIGIIFFVFSLFLAPSVYFLNIKKENLNNVLALSIEERNRILQDTKNEVSDSNKIVSAYLKGKENVSVTDVYFSQIIKNKPDSISLNSFSFKDEDRVSVDVSGVSPRVETISLFVESLKLVSKVEEVIVTDSKEITGGIFDFDIRIIYEK
jgi:hypothetical protein